jgi:hypothetical protein
MGIDIRHFSAADVKEVYVGATLEFFNKWSGTVALLGLIFAGGEFYGKFESWSKTQEALQVEVGTLKDQVRTLTAQNPRAACYESAVRTVDAEPTPYGNKEWRGYRRSERIQSAMADCLGAAAVAIRGNSLLVGAERIVEQPQTD